jgi:hypothetical protein
LGLGFMVDSRLQACRHQYTPPGNLRSHRLGDRLGETGRPAQGWLSHRFARHSDGGRCPCYRIGHPRPCRAPSTHGRGGR